jgi:hypothetical protein
LIPSSDVEAAVAGRGSHGRVVGVTVGGAIVVAHHIGLMIIWKKVEDWITTESTSNLSFCAQKNFQLGLLRNSFM